jgi:hypothetical protein
MLDPGPYPDPQHRFNIVEKNEIKIHFLFL